MKKILIILLSFYSIVGYGQLDITKRKVTLDSLNARQGVIHVNDSIKFGSSGTRIHSIQASNDSLWFNTNLRTIAVPANLNDDIQALYDTASTHLDTLELHASQITSILSDLDTKLNETDTTDMLAPYAKQSALEDTASAIRGDFPSVDSVLYADTSGVAKGLESDTVSIDVIKSFEGDNDIKIAPTIFRLGYNQAGINYSGGYLRFLVNGGISYFYTNPSYLGSQAGGGIRYSPATLSNPSFIHDEDFPNTGVGGLSDTVTLISDNTYIKWNGSRLITQANDTVPWKSELGGGTGTTDSSSITYELDTLKVLNNSIIFFDNPIAVSGNVELANGDIEIDAARRIYLDNDQNRDDHIYTIGDGINFHEGSSSKTLRWVDGELENVTDVLTYATRTDVSDSISNGGVKGDSTFIMKNTEQVWDSIAFSSTINVDFTDGSDYKMVVVTGDITINVTDLYGGESVLWVIQDGTGSHTVTKGSGWGDLRGTGTISTTADAISVVQWQKAVGPGTYSKVIHWID